MIKLDYRLDPARIAHSRGDLSHVSESKLRYHHFAGDQVFIVDGVDLSARWGWVTLLDFAANLLEVVHSLERGERAAEFGFTENIDVIRFALKGDELLVSATYAPGTGAANLTALSLATRAYCSRLASDLVSLNPTLGQNEDFLRWFPSFTSDSASAR